MATHGAGSSACRCCPNASRSSASPPMVADEHRPARHRVPRRRRPSGGHHDRHLGRRPRRDARRAGRPRRQRRRFRAPRPHLPAGRAARRGAASRRAHRGGRRPCAAGGPAAGRRHLRDHRPTTAAWPRLPDLLAFAAEHGLLVVAISDLIAYRRRRERLVERVAEARMPPRDAEFTAIGYRDVHDGREHLALVLGDVARRAGVLVRVHSECLTGDVFGSRRCDCGAQLERALAHDRRRRPRRRRLSPRPRGAGHRAAQQAARLRGCRTAAWTPSTPTSSSGCRVDRARLRRAACRSSPISASDRCGC